MWSANQKRIQGIFYSPQLVERVGINETILLLYRVITNDCSRSKPCPCYEIFAARYKHNFNVA
jgi:hypothetical protein